jgi:hypothetical protein
MLVCIFASLIYWGRQTSPLADIRQDCEIIREELIKGMGTIHGQGLVFFFQF